MPKPKTATPAQKAVSKALDFGNAKKLTKKFLAVYGIGKKKGK